MSGLLGPNGQPIASAKPHRLAAGTYDTLTSVLSDYDLVDVVPNDGDPFVIVAPKGSVAYEAGTTSSRGELVRMGSPGTIALQAQTSPADLGELGSSAPSPFTSWIRREYNNDLMGLNGLQNFDKMRRSDGTVRGTLRIIKTPVLAGRWYIEPASESVQDQNKAKFVWDCLTRYMSISWPQLLTESLLMAEFGYYMFEKVWENRVIQGKTRTVWKKLAPRHPMDVKKWFYDANGGPAGVCMYAPYTATSYPGGSVVPYNPSPSVNGKAIVDQVPQTASLFTAEGAVYVGPSSDEVEIPIDKLLVFTFDREAGNIEGMSVLRSAYKHWYYKEQLYKIDAIQKERHGIGIPIIKLPPSFSSADKAFANELGRNLRTNERAHIVLPPFWEITFAKLEGNPVDSLASIKVHDDAIRENVLAVFNGANSTASEEDHTMFLKSTRFIGEIVCETFNCYAIPELVDKNFANTNVYPRLKVRRIGEQVDQRTLSFAIRNLVGSGILTPDDRLEDYVRDELDLPAADPKTKRILPTPQAPRGPQGPQGQPDPNAPQGTGTQPGDGQNKQDMNKNQVGMPRQTPPSAQPPKANGGRDASGGK